MTTLNNNHWFVYILQCADNTLYTGICKHMTQRLDEHNGVIPNKGAKYTRVRRPVCLVHLEHADNRSQASKREHVIKQMNRLQKMRVIDANQAQTQSLAKQVHVVCEKMV